MLRSLLFGLGIFLLVLGAQTLVVDRWIMSNSSSLANLIEGNSNNQSGNILTAGFSNNGGSYYDSPRLNGAKRVYQTKEWMPWSLLAAGTMIVLYSYSSSGGSSKESD